MRAGCSTASCCTDELALSAPRRAGSSSWPVRFPLAAMALGTFLLGCGSTGDAGPRSADGVPTSCGEPAPCVYVTPDPTRVPPNTLLTYHGRGWRPGRPVRAVYAGACLGGSPPCFFVPQRSERVVPRADGTFVLRLRPPPGQLADPPEVTFRQGGARVDAVAPPGRFSPKDRSDTQAMAAAVTRLNAAVLRRAADPRKAPRRLSRQCSAILGRRGPAVLRRVIGAEHDSSEDTLKPFQPDLERFADDLESVQAEDPALRAGAQAWIRYVRAPRQHLEPGFCTALIRWRSQNFARSQQPIDPEAPSLLNDLRGDPRLPAAAARMRALGVDRDAAGLFAEGRRGVLENLLLVTDAMSSRVAESP